MKTASVTKITTGQFVSMLMLKPLSSPTHELRLEVVEEMRKADQSKRLLELGSNFNMTTQLGISILGSDLCV